MADNTTDPNVTVDPNAPPEEVDPLMTKAKTLYDPSYNAYVNNINTQAASQQTALERLIGEANNAYSLFKSDLDTSLDKNTEARQGALDNEMIDRGFGRSTMFTDRSKIAGRELQDSYTRALTQGGMVRTNAITNYGEQSANIEAAKLANLGTAEADYESNVLAQFYKLSDQAWERDFAERQLAMQSRSSSGTTFDPNTFLTAEQLAAIEAGKKRAALYQQGRDQGKAVLSMFGNFRPRAHTVGEQAGRVTAQY